MLDAPNAVMRGRSRVTDVRFWVELDNENICCRSFLDNKKPILILPGEGFDTLLPPDLFAVAFDQYKGLTKAVNRKVRFYQAVRRYAPCIGTGLAVFLLSQVYCATFHDHTPLAYEVAMLIPRP